MNLTCGRNPWKRASVEDSTFKAFRKDPNFLQTILPVTDECIWSKNGCFTCRETYDSYFEKPDEWQKLYRDLFCGGIPCDENEQVEFMAYAESNQFDLEEDEVDDRAWGV